MEKTFVMIKPDGVKKNIIGEIISRFESKGLRVLAIKSLRSLSREKAEELYAVHRSQPFFNRLVEFVLSGLVVVMVLGGENTVARAREIMGATNPLEAAPATIRADFAQSIEQNTVHGADTKENARREIALFFEESEIAEI